VVCGCLSCCLFVTNDVVMFFVMLCSDNTTLEGSRFLLSAEAAKALVDAVSSVLSSLSYALIQSVQVHDENTGDNKQNINCMQG
jgi:hypothetical protein